MDSFVDFSHVAVLPSGADDSGLRSDSDDTELPARIIDETVDATSENRKSDTFHTSHGIAPKRMRFHDMRTRITLVRQVQILQQWEAVIEEVFKDSVSLKLIDINNSNAMTELAEVSVEDFSPTDEDFIRQGAVFYWTIGYELRKGGQKCRISELRPRRLPPLTNSMAEEAKNRADEMFQRLNG